MGWDTALFGGFASFFSVWQFCLLQISPFFLVYAVGLSLITEKDGSFSPGPWLLLPMAAYALGFSTLYAVLSVRGLDVGRLAISYVGSMRIGAGILILIVCAHFALAALGWRRLRVPMIVEGVLLPLLLGLSFAAVYSPCITPTYARILQLAAMRETATEGGLLALVYGLGTSLAFALVGLVLIFLLGRAHFVSEHKPRLIGGCAVVLGVLGLMNITGVMVYYKAFVLGFLVSA